MSNTDKQDLTFSIVQVHGHRHQCHPMAVWLFSRGTNKGVSNNAETILKNGKKNIYQLVPNFLISSLAKMHIYI